MTKRVPTPIWDFLEQYRDKGGIRLHMPGHKGRPVLGAEGLDVTEIEGADSLYSASGIIAASEREASALWGTADTLYSCGGSSQCIFATLWLLAGYAATTGRAPLVLAARNVHQSFVSALAMTGLDVQWLRPEGATELTCIVDPAALESRLRGMAVLPIAFYLTSPDYLGNVQPIAALAEVCHRYGVLLAVDDAHGAYLRFLGAPAHPIELGADIACDSAHKTLPVLTGGAYLHFGASCPSYFPDNAKDAMLSVGSTSPSYLILASLDRANAILSSADYRSRLTAAVAEVARMRARLEAQGWTCVGDEPLKLTLRTISRGYDGISVAAYLREGGVEPEYADRDHIVLMPSADTTPDEMARVTELLSGLPPRAASSSSLALPPMPPAVTSVRNAYFAPRERLPIAECAGKTLAYLRVSCPPAVPVVIAGESLTPEVLSYLSARGYTALDVLQDRTHPVKR